MVQFGCCFGVLFDLPIERKDKHIEKNKDNSKKNKMERRNFTRFGL
jgi:hypothetical protein